jgi:hypothetical protein
MVGAFDLTDYPSGVMGALNLKDLGVLMLYVGCTSERRIERELTFLKNF